MWGSAVVGGGAQATVLGEQLCFEETSATGAFGESGEAEIRSRRARQLRDRRFVECSLDDSIIILLEDSSYCSYIIYASDDRKVR